jgi:hypothetical protein
MILRQAPPTFGPAQPLSRSPAGTSIFSPFAACSTSTGPASPPFVPYLGGLGDIVVYSHCHPDTHKAIAALSAAIQGLRTTSQSLSEDLTLVFSHISLDDDVLVRLDRARLDPDAHRPALIEAEGERPDQQRSVVLVGPGSGKTAQMLRRTLEPVTLPREMGPTVTADAEGYARTHGLFGSLVAVRELISRAVPTPAGLQVELRPEVDEEGIDPTLCFVVSTTETAERVAEADDRLQELLFQHVPAEHRLQLAVTYRFV